MTAASWALEQERRHLTRKVLYWQGVVELSVQNLQNLIASSDHPVRLHLAATLNENIRRLEEYEQALLDTELEIEVAA